MSFEVEREQAVQALCAHYAQDHLSTGELEARFERVHAARTQLDLQAAVGGLPALTAMAVAAAPLYQLAGPVPSGPVPGLRRRFLSLFSSVKKEGAWAPPPFIEARVYLGELVFDLREALLPPEGIDLDVEVFMGEARVLLPPGLRAEVDASAIMGEIVDKSQRGLPGAPMIRVHGTAFMGTIKVQTKLPRPARLEDWRAQLKGFLGLGGSSTGDEGGRR